MTPEETKHLLKLSGEMYLASDYLINCHVINFGYAIKRLEKAAKKYNDEVMRLQENGRNR